MTPATKRDFKFVLNHMVEQYEELIGSEPDLIQLSSDLASLTGKQLKAFYIAIKNGAQLNDLGHDLKGLANKETCFVPRIRVIAEVS
jgi:hypothetical protein